MSIKKIAQIEFSQSLGMFVKLENGIDYRTPIDALGLIVRARLQRSGMFDPTFEHAPVSIEVLNVEKHQKLGIVPIVVSQHHEEFAWESMRKIEHLNMPNYHVMFEFRDKRHLNLFKLSGGFEKFIQEYHRKMPYILGTSRTPSINSQRIKSMSFMDGLEIVSEDNE